MANQPGPVPQARRPTSLLIVIAILLVAVIALVAMLLSRPPGPTSAATTIPATPPPSASVVPASADASASPGAQPSASAVLVVTTAAPSPARTASPRPTATRPPATNPVIVSFSAPATVTCAGSETLQISLSWRVDRATGVELAIDGPGKYADYPATHTVEVPFACGEPQHTYRITTVGGTGSPATQEKIVRRAS